MTLDTAASALGLSRRTIAYYLSGEQPVPKTVMLATVVMSGCGWLERGITSARTRDLAGHYVSEFDVSSDSEISSKSTSSCSTIKFSTSSVLLFVSRSKM
jgi:hypothetical protein